MTQSNSAPINAVFIVKADTARRDTKQVGRQLMPESRRCISFCTGPQGRAGSEPLRTTERSDLPD